MFKRRLCFAIVLMTASLPGGQTAPSVQVTGAVQQPLVLTAEDLVVFSLGELDPAFIDNEILSADTANGRPLSGARGPFRLVVPKDKPGARSVRMLTKLEVAPLRK
ncbi:MAG: hypothetical protein IT166_11120 [Bryobacterales bacterium]|nr:hypothetical protein [Bryobacterales bacterium]